MHHLTAFYYSRSTMSYLLLASCATAFLSSRFDVKTQDFHPPKAHGSISGRHLASTELAFNISDYDYSRVLQEGESNGANMYWSIRGARIHVALDIYQFNRYFALGLAANGGMIGADVWVLRQAADHWLLEDRFSSDWVTPVLDKRQDLLLEGVKAVGNHVSVAFSRALQTCDGDANHAYSLEFTSQDTDIIKDTPLPLIWARAPSFSSSGAAGGGAVNDGGFPYHGIDAQLRGRINDHSFYELSMNTNVTMDYSNLINIRAVNDPFTLPTQSTTYSQTYYSFPTGTWMLVGLEPVHGVMEKLIHHTLIYACPSVVPQSSVPSENRTEKVCKEILFLFNGLLPKGKRGGIRVGANTTVQSIRVEIHYDNFNNGAAHVDNGSGYELYLGVPHSEDILMGTITTGTIAIDVAPGTPKTAIDQKESSWGECIVPDDVPPEGITVLFTIWHMHLMGRSIWTTVIRDGKEIFLGRNNYYDWNFQGKAGYVPQGTRLYAGDRVVTRCVYSSVNDVTLAKHGGAIPTISTMYGEGTSNEMCFDFILYYPRVPSLSVCVGQNGRGPYKPISRPEVVSLPDFDGSGTKLASNFSATAQGCPSEACAKAAPCFDVGCVGDTTPGIILTSEFFSGCTAAVYCKPCFPYSGCCQGADCLPPSDALKKEMMSAVAVKSENCPASLYEVCERAGVCWRHNKGCNATSRQLMWTGTYSACRATSTCAACFTTSYCGGLNVPSFEGLQPNFNRNRPNCTWDLTASFSFAPSLSNAALVVMFTLQFFV